MIEIIEHGTCNNNVPHEVICENCNCKFTHTRDDCWWYRPLCTYQIECPECKNTINLGDIYEN